MGDRRALVTGGSRGLGAVLVDHLSGAGWDVVTDARRAPRPGEAPSRATIEWVEGDVGSPEHRARLLAAAGRRGGLDLLINNASTLGPSPLPRLLELPPSSLQRILETNLFAPLALIREALPLLEARSGMVVNITSDAAVGGYPGWGGYGASKAALELAGRTLANELRERRISVVTVDPGDLRTQMHQEAFPGEDISDRPLPEVTLPFWAWLLGQDRMRLTGGRFRAQAEVWELPA